MNELKDKLREQLLEGLRGKGAHMTFDEAVADFPLERINEKPPNVPYTPWHIVEHLRISQRDILDFILNEDYKEMNWPEDYWPAQDEQVDEKQWRESIRQFQEDNGALQEIVKDPDTDLFAPLPHGEKYTILREARIVAAHNSYHIGEFAILRQVMETWPESG